MTRIQSLPLVLLFGWVAGPARADDDVTRKFDDLAGRIQVFYENCELPCPQFNPGVRNARADREFADAKALTAHASHDELEALLAHPSPMVRTLAMAELLDTKHPNHPPNGVQLPDIASQEEIDFLSLAENTPVPVLEALLKHADPKVRTLALAALFQKDDPQALPAIVALADDPAPTFPSPAPLDQQVRPGPLPPPEPQTVGAIATDLLKAYLEASGYYYGIKGTAGQPGFADYWEKRKDRQFCAGWFAVQARRIAHNYRYPVDGAESATLRFRRRLDALPPDDRAWNLLELGPAFNLVADDEELVQILRETGPEKLLLYLQRHTPTDDPDLIAARDDRRSEATLFLLKHASALFRPQDADALLAQGAWEIGEGRGGYQPAWWWIAAAQLQPAQADAILRQGYDALQKAKIAPDAFPPLMLALWRTMGEKETALVTNWFYLPNTERYPWIYDQSRQEFLEAVARTPKALNKNLLAHILQDARASTLEPQELAVLATAINGWLAVPIATPEEITRLSGLFFKGSSTSPEKVPGILHRLQVSIPQWVQ
jgi:hypothetical protein